MILDLAHSDLSILRHPDSFRSQCLTESSSDFSSAETAKVVGRKLNTPQALMSAFQMHDAAIREKFSALGEAGKFPMNYYHRKLVDFLLPEREMEKLSFLAGSQEFNYLACLIKRQLPENTTEQVVAFGCSTGVIAHLLKRRGVEAIAVDPSLERVRVSKAGGIEAINWGDSAELEKVLDRNQINRVGFSVIQCPGESPDTFAALQVLMGRQEEGDKILSIAPYKGLFSDKTDHMNFTQFMEQSGYRRVQPQLGTFRERMRRAMMKLKHLINADRQLAYQSQMLAELDSQGLRKMEIQLFERKAF
ncbi:MAG: hypothetical protein RL226_261 [Bacteroidota bacterium]|jgi:hypothetical protein